MYYRRFILNYVRILLVASLFFLHGSEILANHENEFEIMVDRNPFKTLAIFEGVILALSFLAKEQPLIIGALESGISPFVAAVPFMRKNFTKGPSIPSSIFYSVSLLGLGIYNINADERIENAQTREEIDKIKNNILGNNILAWNAILIGIAITEIVAIAGKDVDTIIPIVILENENIFVGVSYRY